MWNAPYLADMDLIDADGNAVQAYDPREQAPASFARMAQLEENASAAKLTEAMGRFPWDRERARESRKAAQAELFSLMESLTPAEMAAFGEYRKTH